MTTENYPRIYLYRRIVQVKLFIDKNYVDDLNLNDVAFLYAHQRSPGLYLRIFSGLFQILEKSPFFKPRSNKKKKKMTLFYNSQKPHTGYPEALQ